MVRWGQAAMRPEALTTALAVFRPELYDAAMGRPEPGQSFRAIGAFAGPAFDPDDIAGHLAAFKIGRWKPYRRTPSGAAAVYQFGSRLQSPE
jgi:NitT/TauT family transport system ATP-binding protein